MPETLTIFAPAKVNLRLAVKDKRADGFHNLESLFLAVNLGDVLRFTSAAELCPHDKELCPSEAGYTISGVGLYDKIPPDKNIIIKALSLFKAKTGFSQNINIYVDKRIPLGGGLGGGSSDAAAALLALNKLAGFPLDRQELIGMGASLGSDVPFFLYETSAAWVTGRGEKIEPVDVPLLYLALVNPGFPSDTAHVFRLLDEYRKGTGDCGLGTGELGSGIRDLGSWTGDFRMKNDFLDVFDEHIKSIYLNIINQLMELGAKSANLSGTGSTCFGIFNEREQACKAVDVLRGKWAFAEVCQTMYFDNDMGGYV
ncbi:MAG: 4-(cytidine 5'-diphospho)-2-C-methyl-D-erythritol kinase [Treponema sp.]|nr:4-(cytidine 5'-diphospho)-2-C-methyl-D-erythritol kinase [Treponema sp.]